MMLDEYLTFLFSNFVLLSREHNNRKFRTKFFWKKWLLTGFTAELVGEVIETRNITFIHWRLHLQQEIDLTAVDSSSYRIFWYVDIWHLKDRRSDRGRMEWKPFLSEFKKNLIVHSRSKTIQSSPTIISTAIRLYIFNIDKYTDITCFVLPLWNDEY